MTTMRKTTTMVKHYDQKIANCGDCNNESKTIARAITTTYATTIINVTVIAKPVAFLLHVQ